MLKKCLTNRWLKECVQLAIMNYNLDGITIKDEMASLAIDNSLVRKPLNLFN
jgi:hypothetical protein